MQDQNQEFGARSFWQGMNFLELLFYGWALSIEVFMRRRFGSRFIGPQGATVLLLVPVYALCWQGYNVGPLFLFLLAYFLLCLAHRGHMFWRTRHGEDTHSRYSGRSIMQGRRCKLSELTVKKYVDPFVALISGFDICAFWNIPLGIYVMIGGVLMHLTVMREQWTTRMRARDLNDAMIDQEQVTNHFRETRGEQWY